jgi:hypothetical protein
LPVKIEAAQLGVQPYCWWVQTRWGAPEVFEDEENRDHKIIRLALQLFSLRYSMGKSQQMFFRAFVTV